MAPGRFEISMISQEIDKLIAAGADLTNYETSPFIVFLLTIPSRVSGVGWIAGAGACTPHDCLAAQQQKAHQTRATPTTNHPSVLPHLHDADLAADCPAPARVWPHAARRAPVRRAGRLGTTASRCTAPCHPLPPAVNPPPLPHTHIPAPTHTPPHTNTKRQRAPREEARVRRRQHRRGQARRWVGVGRCP